METTRNQPSFEVRGKGRRAGLGARLPELLLLLLGFGFLSCGAKENKPNIVFVLVDTLRPDHLGFYGYERETSPFLTSLAETSTVFARAYSSSSWTAPSTASLFTGLYPNRHGVKLGFLVHQKRSAKAGVPEGSIRLTRIPEVSPTLAELLGDHGYRTYAVASNPNIGPEIGFDRGFEFFDRSTSEGADSLVSRILDRKEEIVQDDPFFVYFHLNDVHSPYQPKEKHFESRDSKVSRMVAAYDSEIRELDQVLRQLYEAFGGDDTIFVVASDHGEEFRDHGSFFHGHSLFRELNQILMMLHGPAFGIPARKLEHPVSIVDVLPTLLDLAGVEIPENLDGIDLQPYWKDEITLEAARQRALFAHRQSSNKKDLWSVQRDNWKLITKSRRSLLFDRLSDPKERHDLSELRPEIVEELEREIQKYRRSSAIEGERIIVPVDEELWKELTALGYLK